VTKFFVLAECIDEDGERQMMSVSSDECLEWDQRGMIAQHAALIDGRTRWGREDL
jgi:hypothetical protein